MLLSYSPQQTLNDELDTKTKLSLQLQKRQRALYSDNAPAIPSKEKKGYKIRMAIVGKISRRYFAEKSKQWSYQGVKVEATTAAESICQYHYETKPNQPIGEYTLALGLEGSRIGSMSRDDIEETRNSIKKKLLKNEPLSYYEDIFDKLEKERQKKFDKVIKIWEQQCPSWGIKPVYQTNMFNDDDSLTLHIYITNEPNRETKVKTTKETKNIDIAEKLGTCTYNMYTKKERDNLHGVSRNNLGLTFSVGNTLFSCTMYNFIVYSTTKNDYSQFFNNLDSGTTDKVMVVFAKDKEIVVESGYYQINKEIKGKLPENIRINLSFLEIKRKIFLNDNDDLVPFKQKVDVKKMMVNLKTNSHIEYVRFNRQNFYNPKFLLEVCKVFTSLGIKQVTIKTDNHSMMLQGENENGILTFYTYPIRYSDEYQDQDKDVLFYKGMNEWTVVPYNTFED